MSIVRQLVQIAVVEALRGHTIALENVFDSTMDTVPGLLKGGAQPVLVFSIEESVETVDDATDGFLGRGGVDRHDAVSGGFRKADYRWRGNGDRPRPWGNRFRL